MSNRVKYPLTDEAKKVARYLVEAWNNEQIEQYLEIRYDYRRGSVNLEGAGLFGVLPAFTPPPNGTLLELSEFKLLSIMILPGNSSFRYQITLMQELRNAVETDFEVSDFFLTTQAIGTVVTGDATFNGPFQSGASIYGNISQEIASSELAEKLTDLLGTQLIAANNDLDSAIQELANAPEDGRKLQVGKVISELGRCLQHGASAVVIMQGLGLLAQIFV